MRLPNSREVVVGVRIAAGIGGILEARIPDRGADVARHLAGDAGKRPEPAPEVIAAQHVVHVEDDRLGLHVPQAAVPPTVSRSMRRLGWPTPTGTPWPRLAAGAHAGVERHVVADHRDAGERVRPRADQGGALHRHGDPAVLDQVGLGAGEDELARGDVDLAAAEGLGEEAALDRALDFLRVACRRPACRCWSCAASARGHATGAGRCRWGRRPSAGRSCGPASGPRECRPRSAWCSWRACPHRRW